MISRNASARDAEYTKTIYLIVKSQFPWKISRTFFFNNLTFQDQRRPLPRCDKYPQLNSWGDHHKIWPVSAWSLLLSNSGLHWSIKLLRIFVWVDAGSSGIQVNWLKIRSRQLLTNISFPDSTTPNPCINQACTMNH